LSLRREIPILMYHRVNDSDARPSSVRVDRFRGQMRYLSRKGFHSMTCGGLAEISKAGRALPGRSVLITFDDGYRDNYENAFPILLEFGLTATVFSVSSFIGKSNAWETNPDAPKFPLMDLSMIQTMCEAGIEFGSHTAGHVPLNQIPVERAREEMVQSKKHLEDMLGMPVVSLGYPYNGYNEAVKRMAAGAGYTSACTAGDGPRPLAMKKLSLDLFELRRIVVPQSCTLAEFKVRVSGYYLLLKDLGDKKRWGKVVYAG
jgi:peptidoglycan/xylan/chitin deacetylase (PgdA/CDA1 family)